MIKSMKSVFVMKILVHIRIHMFTIIVQLYCLLLLISYLAELH